MIAIKNDKAKQTDVNLKLGGEDWQNWLYYHMVLLISWEKSSKLWHCLKHLVLTVAELKKILLYSFVIIEIFY